MMVEQNAVSRVPRSKEEARKFYDRISKYYDWMGGLFERKPAVKALDYLKLRSGETVLEIGFGTGFCLQRIAVSVGDSGKVYGIDISDGMILKARKRLFCASLLNRAEFYQGDAVKLPFNDKTFDAVFISFTLELFDSPEISEVLGEIKRVLKPSGRLGIVSLSKTKERSLAVTLYEWVHSKWPKYVDCRPIHVVTEIQKAGYKIILRNAMRLAFLPVEIVIAIKEV
jgi:ubiquinone/menaquinone biosynthesis C-methylase UbiE